MKQTKNLLSLLAVAALALATITSASAQEQRKAKVVRIKGAARYSAGKNMWQPLMVGTELGAGAIIQTAASSFVDIVLTETDKSARSAEATEGNVTAAVSYQPVAERDMVRVFEDSVLSIDRLTGAQTGVDTVRETELDLRAGRIFGTVKKLAAGSHFEIKIPNGVAGIRGTIYTVSSSGVVTVLTGSVVIAYQDGTGAWIRQEVKASFSYDVRTGTLTPLGDVDIKQMIKDAKQDENGPNTPAQTIPVDGTQVYISPTTGHNGGGQPPQ